MAYGQMVFGIREYIDPETGEVVKAYTIQTEATDKDLRTIWLKSVLETLELVGNKKTRVAYWIIENMDQKNELNMTYEEIERATNSAHGTVVSTVKALIEGDFLRRKGNGRYIVNPALVYKGNHGGRMAVLNQYADHSKLSAESKSTEQELDEVNQRILTFMESVEKLKTQAAVLKEKLERKNEQSSCQQQVPSGPVVTPEETKHM